METRGLQTFECERVEVVHETAPDSQYAPEPISIFPANHPHHLKRRKKLKTSGRN